MEGDIILGTVDEFEERLASDDLVFRGVGRDSDSRLWDMPVRYTFGTGVTPAMEIEIEAALARLVVESTADILFEECSGKCKGSHLDFRFTMGGGCSSHVGRRIFGANAINIEEGCDGIAASAATQNRESSVMMHEIMHALGVHHEQSRCDRDDFVTVHFDQIESGRGHNFNTHCGSTTDYGIYDYESVMHYGEFAFSIGGPTLTATDPAGQSLMGTRDGLQRGDRDVLVGLYGLYCEPSQSQCGLGDCGFLDVGCGVLLNCGSCVPCSGTFCPNGACCPDSGICSDGSFCAV